MGQRFPLLDVIRLLCALSVAMAHYCYTAPIETKSDAFVFAPTTAYGTLGVQIFFMVSGFVIAVSMEGRTSLEFLWARFVRLFPTYWLCVTVTWVTLLLLTPAAPSLGTYLVNLTMLQALLDVPHIDGVYWTLGVELKFYAFVFLLMLFRLPLQSYGALGFLLAISVADNLQSGIIGKLTTSNFGSFFVFGVAVRMMMSPGRQLGKAALLIATLAAMLHAMLGFSHRALALYPDFKASVAVLIIGVAAVACPIRVVHRIS